MANYQLEQTGAEVQALLNAVESPDTTPAAGSSNLITSGAVQAAVAGVSAEVTALGQEVDDLDLEVNGGNISLSLTDVGMDADTFMNFTTGALSSLTGQYVSKPIPCITGMTYNIFWDNATGQFNTARKSVWGYAADGTTPISGTGEFPTDGQHITYRTDDPAVKYFRIRLTAYMYGYPAYMTISSVARGLVDDISDLGARLDEVEKIPALYVATNGSDTNSGDISHPFATINKAISSANKDGAVILVSAGDYKEAIDFTQCKVNKISLRSASVEDVVRVHGAGFHAISKVSGYTNIYSASAEIFISGNGEYIAYVDKCPSLPVDGADLFPQMSGVKYRLPFIEMTDRLTKDYATLADALAFMDAQTEDCLWYDSANQVVYMASTTDLTDYQLAVPEAPTWKLLQAAGTQAQKLDVEIMGIDFYYAYAASNAITASVAIDPFLFARFRLVNCKLMGNHRAALSSRAFVNEIIGCEAGGNGNDGFSSMYYAADYSVLQNNKDFLVLYDSCWSHDNYDDGFTDHVRNRDIVKNCLSSHNYLGDGFHFVGGGASEFYNCIAYKNGSHGFVQASGADDGREACSMLLMGCVSIESKVGFAIGATAALDAYMRCVSCKSIGNTYGYRISNSSTSYRRMTLTDCGSLNDTTPKSNTQANADIIVENTTPLS